MASNDGAVYDPAGVVERYVESTSPARVCVASNDGAVYDPVGRIFQMPSGTP